MSAERRAKCRAVERTSAGAFTCDRERGHYPDTMHAAHGLGSRVVWLWEDTEPSTEPSTERAAS